MNEVHWKKSMLSIIGTFLSPCIFFYCMVIHDKKSSLSYPCFPRHSVPLPRSKHCYQLLCIFLEIYYIPIILAHIHTDLVAAYYTQFITLLFLNFLYLEEHPITVHKDLLLSFYCNIWCIVIHLTVPTEGQWNFLCHQNPAAMNTLVY